MGPETYRYVRGDIISILVALFWCKVTWMQDASVMHAHHSFPADSELEFIFHFGVTQCDWSNPQSMPLTTFKYILSSWSRGRRSQLHLPHLAVQVLRFLTLLMLILPKTRSSRSEWIHLPVVVLDYINSLLLPLQNTKYLRAAFWPFLIGLICRGLGREPLQVVVECELTWIWTSTHHWVMTTRLQPFAIVEYTFSSVLIQV